MAIFILERLYDDFWNTTSSYLAIAFHHNEAIVAKSLRRNAINTNFITQIVS